MFEAVKEASEMIPAKRAVEKEDRSNRDEVDEVCCVALEKPQTTQIQPIGAPLCIPCKDRLYLETDAGRTGFEVREQCGPSGTGADVDEDVVASHGRVMHGVQDGRNRTWKVGYTATGEVESVGRILFDVP